MQRSKTLLRLREASIFAKRRPRSDFIQLRTKQNPGWFLGLRHFSSSHYPRGFIIFLRRALKHRRQGPKGPREESTRTRRDHSANHLIRRSIYILEQPSVDGTTARKYS